MNQAATIFHIANEPDIHRFREQNHYQCESLTTEGFIHCCEKDQLAGVVQRYYLEVDDVYLMLLDPDKLNSPLIRENTMGGSELFPHVYGTINSEAVRSILPFGLASTERLGLLS